MSLPVVCKSGDLKLRILLHHPVMSNPNPKLSVMQLPVGFIFNPKEVDLLTFYLKRKLDKTPVAQGTITDFDVYSQDPEQLPGKFTHGRGRNEEIFFSRRQRSSTKGIRAKRLVAGRDGTHVGHWHGNKDEPIYSDNVVVGLKTSLTFARSTGRRGEKDIPTDWIMHEFRLPGHGFQEYAICKVYNKNANYKRKGKSLQKAPATAGFEPCSFMSQRGNLTIREPPPDRVHQAPPLCIEGKGKGKLYEEVNNGSNPFINAHQEPSLLPSSSSVHGASMNFENMDRFIGYGNFINQSNNHDSSIMLPLQSYHQNHSAYQDPAFGNEHISSTSEFLNFLDVPRQEGLLWEPGQPAQFPGNYDMGKDVRYMVTEEEEDFEVQYSKNINLAKAVSPVYEDPPMLPLAFKNNHGSTNPPPPEPLPKRATTVEDDLYTCCKPL